LARWIRSCKPSESRFFKYVWRFNALAIAGAAIGVILLGSIAGFTLFKRGNADPPGHQGRQRWSAEDKSREEFSLGLGRCDRRYLLCPRCPLSRAILSAVVLSEASDQNVVNYLFLNTSTNESRWLFERVGQLIVEVQILFNKVKVRADEARTGVGVFYVVIDEDSNGDNG
jgi:hypothetical protein